VIPRFSAIALLLFASLALIPGRAAAGEGSSPRFVAELEKGRSQKIVAYGTSLTASAAWPAGLQQQLRGRFGRKVQVVNAAGNGMDSRWGLANLAERVLKEKPAAVLIEFTVNDALGQSKLSPRESAANLTEMIRRIRGCQPPCEVIVMIMNPPTGQALAKRAQIRRYESGYRSVAQRESCSLVDFSPLWRRMMAQEPARWQRYAPDGLHPTAAAGDEVILPYLLEKIGFTPPATRHPRGS
jgi:acyl-CoA thioesterase I